MARLFVTHQSDGVLEDLGRASLQAELTEDRNIALLVDTGSILTVKMTYDEAATLMQALHTSMKLSVERAS